jgi:hypothetical protein
MKINIGKYPKKDNNRKIDIKIEKFDTYSMDHTLALIILPMLLQLKTTKHGVPHEFAEVGGEDYSSQECFDFYREDYDEMFNKKILEWDNVLDKMIWSFQQLAMEDYESQYHHGKANFSWEKTDKKFLNPVTGKMESTFQIIDKNPDDHWFDHEGLDLHNKKIQEGLDLFAKYYRNLWD